MFYYIVKAQLKKKQVEEKYKIQIVIEFSAIFTFSWIQKLNIVGEVLLNVLKSFLNQSLKWYL
jgi:hypothetical protein